MPAIEPRPNPGTRIIDGVRSDRTAGEPWKAKKPEDKPELKAKTKPIKVNIKDIKKVNKRSEDEVEPISKRSRRHKPEQGLSTGTGTSL